MSSKPRRILVLVPHEPRLDPRVGWVTDLCAGLARTEVIAAVPGYDGPRVAYDGRVSTELVAVDEFASTPARAVASGLGSFLRLAPVAAYLERTQSVLESEPELAGFDWHVGAAGRLVAVTGSLRVLTNALERRCRALSVPPDVVVCHDVQTLPAGLALKRRFGTRVLYDSHEWWPEINFLAPRWEQTLMAERERRLVRRADAVVTVSQPLARHLERRYGLEHVVAAPNAAPFEADDPARPDRPSGLPVRVLYLGRAAPGRGLESVLEAWRAIDPGRAILSIRAPHGAYLERLRGRFTQELARGSIEILDPVAESDLVEAATAADVGLIPYPARGLQHRYACPNKLSQYMQAGLAILAERLDYVAEILDRYECGLTYDSRRPATIGEAVEALAGDLERLAVLKRNAYEAARAEFNWAAQSADYRQALSRLLDTA